MGKLSLLLAVLLLSAACSGPDKYAVYAPLVIAGGHTELCGYLENLDDAVDKAVNHYADWRESKVILHPIYLVKDGYGRAWEINMWEVDTDDPAPTRRGFGFPPAFDC